MNIEQRVRTSLTEDGRRIEVPPVPPLSELVRSQGRSRLLLGGLAAAAVLLVGLVVVVMGDWARPGGLEIGPADEPDRATFGPIVSYDGGDVFASGVTDRGVDWTGAANVTERLPCVGIQVSAPGVVEEAAGCHDVRSAVAVRLAAVVRPADHGVVGVAGWVSDDVARLVWVLPDGTVELDLHTKPGLPARLFAGGAHVAPETTMIEAYDAAGDRLATIGVAGSSEPDPAAGPT